MPLVARNQLTKAPVNPDAGAWGGERGFWSQTPRMGSLTVTYLPCALRLLDRPSLGVSVGASAWLCPSAFGSANEGWCFPNPPSSLKTLWDLILHIQLLAGCTSVHPVCVAPELRAYLPNRISQNSGVNALKTILKGHFNHTRCSPDF